MHGMGWWRMWGNWGDEWNTRIKTHTIDEYKIDRLGEQTERRDKSKIRRKSSAKVREALTEGGKFVAKQ